MDGDTPHPPTPQALQWVPPHTPYPLTRTNNSTFFPNSIRITQQLHANNYPKTTNIPSNLSNHPPSNYTPRSLQKYIISKVKLGSPVVCNSPEPSIHAGSQPFRYVSAGSTYCHYDLHLKYPTPCTSYTELHKPCNSLKANTHAASQPFL